MTAASETDRRVWQPLTPRGVAAFARAPLSRLLLVQVVVAVLAMSVMVWFLQANWFPVVSEAIRQMPSGGQIAEGKLKWPGNSPQILAEGRFLSLAVDLNHEGKARSPAQVSVEFGRDEVWIFSLFGYIECPYLKGWIVEFNRPELEPRWEAWRPPVLWVAAVLGVLGLMGCWALLATTYCLVVWLAGFFANRDLDLWASWKLSGAALMPGALLMAAGIGLYGLGIFDLVKCLVVVGVHLVVGWVYVFLSPFFAPKLSPGAVVRGNPFASFTKKADANKPRD